ncbi:queuosine-tRNA galactosyltransferase-like [Littorina saxatilis]|uniref:queuosine-tRNA galactosyltransferase-like n=1 Tax=Littorina saxatilis TaxID=31220 RepID=UPI0038B61D50
MADVSIITPVHNGERYLEECLLSVAGQSFTGRLELSIYNDGSKDKTQEILDKWKERLEEKGVTVVINGHDDDTPRGVGYAKNRAVAQSSGKCLCFLDADDVMDAERVSCQYEAALANPLAIVGCQFHREPKGSTARFTEWANIISPKQLYSQIYTSHGPTVIMPTWYCLRAVFEKVGGFDEGGKGVPEDLIFFYRHLDLGGEVVRVDRDLLMYRYHPHATTFSITEETIWTVRMDYIQRRLIDTYTHFSIWSAGKQGRRFFRSLSPNNQVKVQMFCDVDEKKIRKQYYTYEESKERPKPKIPIVHFSQVKPPVVICVKMNLTGGGFEDNLASVNLQEGVNYMHFN